MEARVETAATLDADHRAPGAARDLVRELAERAGCERQQVERAVLLVSELVTNAVLHGDGRALRVTSTADGATIRVAVHDRSPGRPVPREVGPDELHGRGLGLVTTLAADWGVEAAVDGDDPGAGRTGDGGGKAVWFRLPCHAGAGSGAG